MKYYRHLLVAFVIFIGGCFLPPLDDKPAPSPKPVSHSALFIITVDDAGDRSPTTSALLRDPKLWKDLRSSGNDFRQLDTDDCFVKKCSGQSDSGRYAD